MFVMWWCKYHFIEKLLSENTQKETQRLRTFVCVRYLICNLSFVLIEWRLTCIVFTIHTFIMHLLYSVSLC